jgi:hypothetical protein
MGYWGAPEPGARLRRHRGTIGASGRLRSRIKLSKSEAALGLEEQLRRAKNFSDALIHLELA